MSEAKTHPDDYGWRAPVSPIVHALKQNKRPVGFAPWPEQNVEEVTPATPKRKKHPKRKLGVK